MITSDPQRPTLLLAIQSALVGEIFPALAAVDISWDEQRVEIVFYVDEKLSDDDHDSISSVEAEMTAHINDKVVSSEIVVGKRSGVSREAVCVFARRNWP